MDFDQPRSAPHTVGWSKLTFSVNCEEKKIFFYLAIWDKSSIHLVSSVNGQEEPTEMKTHKSLPYLNTGDIIKMCVFPHFWGNIYSFPLTFKRKSCKNAGRI